MEAGRSHWLSVAAAVGDARSAERSPDEVLAFLGGRSPHWVDCLPGASPRRATAEGLTEDFLRASSKAAVGKVRALIGPIGEGKSTVARQVAVDVAARGGSDWAVYWRRPKGAITAEDIAGLPGNRNTLLVSDDAEEVANSLYRILQDLQRNDVHFLLVATSTDWGKAGASVLPWNNCCAYREERLEGLSDADSLLIIQEWERVGDAALGDLRDVDGTVRRAEALREAAMQEATAADGALLGGLLRVRYGDHLVDHIRGLMIKMTESRVGATHSLATAYVVVAAAHSERLPLSPEILARYLGVPTDVVWSAVVEPLQDEAVLTMAGGLILTRHRLIAKASLTVVSHTRLRLSQVFAGLVRAALRVGKDGFVDGFNRYARLSRRFEESDPETAIETARVVCQEEPNILSYQHDLVHLLRVNDRAKEAAFICEQVCARLREMKDRTSRGATRRIFYLEWAVCEGLLGNRAIDAWLSAVAIADLPPLKKGEPEADLPVGVASQEHVERALLSISLALLELAGTEPMNSTLAGGMQAVFTMCRRLSLSDRAARYLGVQEERATALRASPVDAQEAPALLSAAVVEAWRRRERDIPSVPAGNPLSFQELCVRLGLAD